MTSGCWLTESLVTSGVAAPSARPSLDQDPVLLVATTRRAITERPWFGAQRGRGLTFAEARLSPPDRSLTGRVASIVTGDWNLSAIERTDNSPNAATAFVNAALGRDVLIYVHGYRESFESAALSSAQLSSGIGFRGASALFTWPSGGATFDYVSDRDSVMWSRDAFEDLLKALSDSPSGGRVHIVAHSMGTLLTLETLRMLRASGGESSMARIGAVVLAAPDVDLDLFTRGVERLGPDAKKITVISSTNDRALAISARLSGNVRAGAADREQLVRRLEPLGVRIADASEYGSGFINHDLFLSNQEVQQVVKRAVARAD
ncbi:MAG TPA: alpha/beta fold hydrolase [Beijerinckiaceae bacterium]|nr:alpha/beta fold hydrolase [Beijerinckiaceae bacterium]